jgi:ABC-2 type transport system permease protein
MTANSAINPRALRPVAGRGWRLGFANMLANENGRWWGKRRWLIPLAIFVAFINGPILLDAATADTATNSEYPRTALSADVLAGMLIVTTTIGVIVTTQGAIIGEKQLGTAAWVMSKPASRAGFVLAKFISTGAGMLLLAVPIPAAIYYAEAQLFWGRVPALGTVMAATAIAALHMLYYLALTLMLDSLFASRAPVAATGVGLFIVGFSIGTNLPLLPYIMPWLLPNLAVDVSMGQVIHPAWPIPVMAVIVEIIVFVVVALWRFSREEF